jgi:hypothetical protein
LRLLILILNLKNPQSLLLALLINNNCFSLLQVNITLELPLKLLKEADSSLEFVINHAHMFTSYNLLQDLLNDYSFNNIAYTCVTSLGLNHFINSKGKIVFNTDIQVQAKCYTLVD